MNKRILITGAAGFIGSYLMGCLKERYDVIGTVRTREKAAARNLRVCDWSEGTCAVPDVDIVIHAAALTPGRDKSFRDFFDQNVMMARNVVSFARENRVKKIIFFASVSSYGKVDRILSEVSPHNAMDDYGLTKYVAEKLVEASGIPYEILILPGVVGPGCRPVWLVNVAKKLSRNETVTCFNLEGLFNNVADVRDIAVFVESLVEKADGKSGRFLLGAEDRMTVGEVVGYMKGKLRSSSEIRESTQNSNGFFLDTSHAAASGFCSRPLKEILDGICGEAGR